MDSYLSRATVVDMPTCRAFNRCQQIVLGDLCRMKETEPRRLSLLTSGVIRDRHGGGL